MSQAAVAIVSPEGDCGREQSGQTSSRCRVEVVSIPRALSAFRPDSCRIRLDVSCLVRNELLAIATATASTRTDDHVPVSGDPRDIGFAAIRTSV